MLCDLGRQNMILVHSSACSLKRTRLGLRYHISGGDEQMVRAPFQVLVLPFRRTEKTIEYAIFRRSDAGYWQGIAGGGEDEETPLQAARREAEEEAGISAESHYLRLDATSTVRVEEVVGTLLWGEDVRSIPEYCFGVEAMSKKLVLSGEHVESRWTPYATAIKMLHWDSNKTALRELDLRLLTKPED